MKPSHYHRTKIEQALMTIAKDTDPAFQNILQPKSKSGHTYTSMNTTGSLPGLPTSSAKA